MIFLLLICPVFGLAIKDLPLSSKLGQLKDDNLLHWSDGRVDIARSSFSAGSELILSGTVTGANDSHVGNVWEGCEWITPDNEVWRPKGENMVDASGYVVEGVEVWGETVATCGIKILKANIQTHVGQWYVRFDITEDPLPTLYWSLDTEDQVSTGLRLPTTFQPLSYDVVLIPELNSSLMQPLTGEGSIHRFRGFSGMKLLALSNTESLTYHSDELTTGSLELRDNTDGINMTFDAIVFDYQRTLVTIIPKDKSFIEGHEYNVDILFEADLDRGNRFNYGFYHRACSDDTDVHCWYTQGESTNARNFFPCLDEPGFKANFTLYVGRGKDYMSLSNMPLDKTFPMPSEYVRPGEEDWEIDQYQSSVAMSAYLVAVTITNYASKSSAKKDGEIPTKVWAPQADIEAGRADYAAEIGPEIISFYENYFGVKYPLPKMDLQYEPKKGGAMENWGLILFDERALLIDPDSKDDDLRFQVLNIIAHELAHQWFGNIVTTNWWDQTWLNEGFATFVSYIGSDHIDPESHPWPRLYIKETQRVMHGDQDLNYNWAMSDPVTTRNDIERKFGMFTYQKGGSVIRMMEQILGKETFTKGLSYYLRTFSFGSTTEDDLFSYLEEVAVEDGKWPQSNGPRGSLSESLKTWTDQAGLPVVNANKTCSSSTECSVTFSQKWLTMAGPVEGRRWDVPLTFALSSEINTAQAPQLWLTANGEEMVTVDIPGLEMDNSFIANLEGTGYYRVNYDEQSWKEIGNTLKSSMESIIPLNRAMIVCDVLALEEVGLINTELMEHVLSYMDQETEYAPLLAFEKCTQYTSGFKEEQELLRI